MADRPEYAIRMSRMLQRVLPGRWQGTRQGLGLRPRTKDLWVEQVELSRSTVHSRPSRN